MQKKNEKRVLLSNTIAFGVGTLGAKVIMFFLLPVYTTYMTTAELGVAELIVSTSATSIIIYNKCTVKVCFGKRQRQETGICDICAGYSAGCTDSEFDYLFYSIGKEFFK